ncbi:protein farnesyltransferase [Malassezia cuniculi]|uniref:Protein farnesyltransferase subunit beta n=1 Tax=Malassezia cuniculi TaxID=948313 RepID=A0AAF0J7X3_9BASI|nr:protein farnesyltransferase [Malassezia cuniculi]
MPPKGRGVQSPFAKLAENNAARAAAPPSPAGSSGSRASKARPSAPSSPAPPATGAVAHDAFQLPRALESTTHRRLRGLLQDVLREATLWEEEHTLEGIKWASEAKSAWDQVATAALAGDARRAELVSALQTIDEASEQLHSSLARIVGERNPEVAFVDPMWATWTLERFVVAMKSLCMQYSVSDAYLAVVVAALTGREERGGTGGGSGSGNAKAADLQGVAAQMRDMLSEFVRLPHLHPSGVSGTASTFSADADSECGVSRHFFEHVCETEVRETSVEQKHTEELIDELFAPHRGPDAEPLPPLRRREHVGFLRRVLEPLGAPFVVFDSNRAWLIYWTAHALDLLGEPLDDTMRVRAVSTLLHFQDPSGGFGGGPGQLPHLMSTYAAVCAMAIVGGPGGAPSDEQVRAGSTANLGWDAIDRGAMYDWMMRLKQPDGSFLVHVGGEIDVRATYCVVVVASILGICTKELLSGVGAFVAGCQTHEGGFAALTHARYTVSGDVLVPMQPAEQQEPLGEAHGGYSFCALAAHTHLSMLGVGSAVDMDALVRWAVSLQGIPIEGGGFRGRTNKLVDGCYGWFCGGGLMTLLESLVDDDCAPPLSPPGDNSSGNSDSWVSDDLGGDLFDRRALTEYILVAAQAPRTGGLRDKPGKRADAYHTCYNLSGLSLCLHHVRPSAAAEAAALVEPRVGRREQHGK